MPVFNCLHAYIIKTLSKAELDKAKSFNCLQDHDFFFNNFFRIAVEKLHKMDNAFRKKLESVLAAHQEELLHLENEKEKQIEAANEKVILTLNLYIYCICVFILQLLQKWCLEVSSLTLSG